MKSIQILCVAFLLLTINTLQAQAPKKMSYQAIVRNAGGNAVAQTNVSLRISILNAVSAPVYVETHSALTNGNGLVSIQIGGGTVQSGDFGAIDWSAGTFFLQTETDPEGGTNFSIIGTTQLLSVPYALYASSSRQQGKTNIYIFGNITNEQATAKLDRELGPNTENIYIQNTTVLTTLDISGPENLSEITIRNNQALTSITFSSLKSTYKQVACYTNPQLTSVQFPMLEEVLDRFFLSQNTSLSSVGFPALKVIKGFSLELSYNALTAVELPQLTNSSNLQINEENLTSLSVPALKYGSIEITKSKLPDFTLPEFLQGNINMTQNSLIASVNLPLLTYGSIYLVNNSTLASVSFPSLTSLPINNWSNIASIGLQQNHLSSGTVNDILHQMLTVLPASGKNIEIRQFPPAPPTGQGIIDKAALVNTGNTVLSD